MWKLGGACHFRGQVVLFAADGWVWHILRLKDSESGLNTELRAFSSEHCVYMCVSDKKGEDILLFREPAGKFGHQDGLPTIYESLTMNTLIRTGIVLSMNFSLILFFSAFFTVYIILFGFSRSEFVRECQGFCKVRRVRRKNSMPRFIPITITSSLLLLLPILNTRELTINSV